MATKRQYEVIGSYSKGVVWTVEADSAEEAERLVNGGSNEFLDAHRTLEGGLEFAGIDEVVEVEVVEGQ